MEDLQKKLGLQEVEDLHMRCGMCGCSGLCECQWQLMGLPLRPLRVVVVRRPRWQWLDCARLGLFCGGPGLWITELA